MKHHNHNAKNAAREARGFTLIELLVVIAIIALLSAVVLAALNTARARGRDAKRLSDMEQVQNALEEYAASNGGAYPNTLSVCASSGGYCGTCSTWGSKATSGATGYIPNLAPTYITILPTDPQPNTTIAPTSGNCYIFRSDGNDYKFTDFNNMESYTQNSNPKPNPARSTSPDFSIYTIGAAQW